jgi:hypothetical protein
MADRYWVGGTASWDGTAGTKWSATSGGAGGASVPTTADDVFFDASSTGTVTIASGNTGAKSINCTGFTGTLTGTADLTVAGSITLVAGMTYTHTGKVTITGTSTLTTAGKNFSELVVNSSGITLTLADALNCQTRSITITQGTFTTSNYNVTCSTLLGTGTSLKTFNLGSSTVTLSNTSPLNLSGSNLTFNAGTSQINLSSTANITFNGSSLTFYNVSFTNANSSSKTITGANTFNNLLFTAPSAASLASISFSANQTINGTLTCAGATSLRRLFVASNSIGTSRTLTVASISANDCDFRDITLGGAAAGASPTRAGDCGGNSGITFPAAKTVYRVGTNTTWAGSSSWALTSGGAGADNNFPLAQDTAVIDEATTLTGTLSTAIFNVGSIDCSTRTTGITLSFGSGFNIHGSLTFGSGVTISGTGTQNFVGRGTSVITSAGKTITFAIYMWMVGGTLLLGDALTITGTNGNGSIELNQGTLDAATYNLTLINLYTTSSLTRQVNMGSGLWTFTGTGTLILWANPTVNATWNKGTANVLLSNNSTTARTFSPAVSFNKLTIGGDTSTSTTTLGASSFTEIASTKTVAHTILLGSDLGTVDTWSVTGTAGNVVTFQSNSAGARRNFTLTNKTSAIDYLNVRDIGELSGFKFAVGANSTDSGNNFNVYFTAIPPEVPRGNMFLFFD